MAKDFISRPRTWDQGQELCYEGHGQGMSHTVFVLEAPRGRGQVLEDTSLHDVMQMHTDRK